MGLAGNLLRMLLALFGVLLLLLQKPAAGEFFFPPGETSCTGTEDRGGAARASPRLTIKQETTEYGRDCLPTSKQQCDEVRHAPAFIIFTCEHSTHTHTPSGWRRTAGNNVSPPGGATSQKSKKKLSQKKGIPVELEKNNKKMKQHMAFFYKKIKRNHEGGGMHTIQNESLIGIFQYENLSLIPCRFFLGLKKLKRKMKRNPMKCGAKRTTHL